MNNTFDKVAFQAVAAPVGLDSLSAVRRCTVLVPHPDDESLGCAGLLATLVAAQCEIQVILTTDGSKSHPNSLEYPEAQLIALRHSELLHALMLLGITSDGLISYGARDAAMPGKTQVGFEELTDRLATDLRNFAPDLILVPYELDPHCDHRATWQLLMAALERSTTKRPMIWEYPIWLYAHAAAEDIPHLNPDELLVLDVSRYAALKEKCIYAHQSQTRALISDDPSGFMLSAEMIANFTSGNEYYMQRKKLNPDATLSVDYFEKLYTGNIDPWNFETSDYERSKYLATIAAIPDRAYLSALEIGCSIGVLTDMLASKCNRLTAMDISQVALEKARSRLQGSSNVDFLLGGVPADFPNDRYDLIVMSEVGYYLRMDDLLLLREQVIEALEADGILVLVHWTHFVVDYPLTGDQVHDGFIRTNLELHSCSRTADYRLEVYTKPKRSDEF
ncbi:LmbE family protein [Pedobacter sp. BAL39]|uniref:bifunctional PIG-L family deacetylase/class I SAM-dependent methyltransferase n=1 Tax=Pedobacter sp. BAL39 TaxID=391596 RepID=UPI0001559D1F|nr:bifunctional PIG-L family deacetylase/class I SAM-dependent methyltransferase [Pedobacter sp. BAL39]EDM35930.1 LmbE family protein [Pedobacter sp. BAL39]